MNAHTGFPLPDLTTSLPRAAFRFSPKAAEDAAAVIEAGPAGIFRQLLDDQESETTRLVARRTLHAFLPAAEDEAPADADAIAARVRRARTAIEPALAGLRERGPQTYGLVLRQRAPLMLLAGCWLDDVSQTATQPSVIVNRLFGQHFFLQGEGTPSAGCSPGGGGRSPSSRCTCPGSRPRTS